MSIRGRWLEASRLPCVVSPVGLACRSDTPADSGAGSVDPERLTLAREATASKETKQPGPQHTSTGDRRVTLTSYPTN